MTARLGLVALAAAAGAGCAFGDGAGWADVHAEVTAVLAGERTVESGEFVVRVDALSLTVDGVALYTAPAAGGGGQATFDPANPPPGYSLCHGGHCHNAAGGIESYEEIRAKLAGGGGEVAEVLHGVLEGGGRLDVLTGGRIELPEQPRGAVRVTSVAPRIRSLDLEGVVTWDDGGDPQTVPLVVALAPHVPVPLREGPDAEGLPLTVGPDGPRAVALECEVEVGGTLLDGVRWSNLARADGVIRIDAETEDNHAAWELFLAKLAVLPVGVQAHGAYE